MKFLSRYRRLTIWLLLTGFLAGYCLLTITLPLPAPKLTATKSSQRIDTGSAAPLPWPDALQTAIGAPGYGILAADGPDTAVPMASVAKVVTALAVLRQKPLELNTSGPKLVMTEEDVGFYNLNVARNGSVTPLAVGDSMSQYQALQTLLLPSSNNMAQTLATWAFGSEAAYVAYANTMIDEMGLQKTRVADSSGFSPQTVSSARDLVKLGEEALKNPVLAEIVSQKQAVVPGAGALSNTNAALGIEGVNGLKTGTSLEAGSCLLFSAQQIVGDQPITVIGVVLGANNREAARIAAIQLVNASYTNFIQVQPIKAGDTVATIHPAWADAIEVKAKADLKQVVWKGSNLELTINTHPTIKGQPGEAKLGNHTTALELTKAIPPANLGWRLTQPFTLLQAAFGAK